MKSSLSEKNNKQNQLVTQVKVKNIFSNLNLKKIVDLSRGLEKIHQMHQEGKFELLNDSVIQFVDSMKTFFLQLLS